MTMLRAALLGLQDQFLLDRVSLIDAMQLDSQERAFKLMLSQPVMRALWNWTRHTYAPEFASYLDALIEGIPLAAPYDLGARLKEDAESLRAGAR